MTVGKDQELTVKSKGAGGQGKVDAKVTGPSGKPISSKVGISCSTGGSLVPMLTHFFLTNNTCFVAGGARAEPRDKPGEVHPP